MEPHVTDNFQLKTTFEIFCVQNGIPVNGGTYGWIEKTLLYRMVYFSFYARSILVIKISQMLKKHEFGQYLDIYSPGSKPKSKSEAGFVISVKNCIRICVLNSFDVPRLTSFWPLSCLIFNQIPPFGGSMGSQPLFGKNVF